MRPLVAASTHGDEAARVESMRKEHNLHVYELLSALVRATCMPVALNARFNVKGQSIVDRPGGALGMFFMNGISRLAIAPFLVSKD